MCNSGLNVIHHRFKVLQCYFSLLNISDIIGIIARIVVGECHQVSINKVTTERHLCPDDGDCFYFIYGRFPIVIILLNWNTLA